MTLGNQIAYLRKQMGLTQEGLAQKLEVTNQAVSKWESDACCPDILLLPKIADVFGVTLDELFGREPKAEPAREEKADPVKNILDMGLDVLDKVFGKTDQAGSADGKVKFSFEKTFDASVEELEKETKEKKPSWKFQEVNWEQFDTSKMDWEDDGVLRVVLFAGRKLLMGTPMAEKVEFRYDGPALNVYSQCNLSCDNVQGDVYAGGNVTCDDVGGDIHTEGNVTCDDVTGDVEAGGNVTCDAIDGDVTAGGTVTCDELSDCTVQAGRDVECDEMNDCTVHVGGDLRCEEINDCGIECMGGVSSN